MDVERAQAILAEIRSKKFTRKEFWSPKPGLNSIRILPSWTLDLSKDFFRKTAQHWKLGNNQDLWVTCLIEEGYERCPVCEKIDRLYRTKIKEDSDSAKLIRKQIKVLWNIIDMNSVSKGVQVWQSGITVLGDLLKFVGNSKYGDISHPTTGRNIDIVMTEAKESKTGWNDYAIQPDPERSAIAEMEWLEQLQDLDLLVRIKSAEEVDYILEKGELPPDGVIFGQEAPTTQKSQEVKPEEIQTKPEPMKSSGSTKSSGGASGVVQEKDVNSLLAKLRAERAESKK